jgi:predicted MPP superfamily phosphohydrolase
MSLFLLTFFVIYGGVHLYTLFKVRSAFALGGGVLLPLALFLALMVIAPVLVRIIERQGHEESARVVAYIGYTWMGLLFFFFTAALAVDIYRLFLYVAGLGLHRDFSLFSLSSRSAVLIPLVYATLATVYGYFEARDIRVERLVIATAKLPPLIERVRIVQLSDVHLGLIVREKRLQRILRVVQNAEPDLLVSTGDLVDGQLDGLTGMADAFRKIVPRYGKFAITGNHEFYAGLDQSLEFMRLAGFTVLRGEGASVAGTINIVGVDDPAAKNFGLQRQVVEKELLAGLPPGSFTLLLKHRPEVDRGALGFFDLQLSGHVHNGQLFPFQLVTRLFYPLPSGYTALPKQSAIYLSRGTGTWGPPLRFLAPPEVTVIDLVRLPVPRSS